MTKTSYKAIMWKVTSSIAVPGIVSFVVTTAVNYESSIRLENKKNQYAATYQAQKDFDDTHNALVGEIGLFTGKFFKGKPINQNKFEETATKAILQATQLQQHVGSDTQLTIRKYEETLDKLRKDVNRAKQKEDLDQIFDNFLELTKLKDTVDAQVTSDEKINPL